MAELVNKTLDAVCALPLQLLDADWVKACWDGHFLDLTPLPLVTDNLLQEEGYCTEQLESLHSIAKQWQKSQTHTEGLWTLLLENNVSHKALVALLAHLIPVEHNSKSCRGQKKEAAFAAATVYLSLIGLPGSRAFKIYNPDLLLRAIDMLKADAAFGAAKPKKRGAQAMASSQRSQTHARKRSRNATQPGQSSQSCVNDDMEDDESDDGEEDLTPSRVQQFRSLYLNLLTELVELLTSFSLRESLLTAEHILKVLASLTRLDNSNFDGLFPLVSPARRQGQGLGVAALAFKGILSLCQPLHGDVTALTTATCKYLLPNALMLLEGNKVCAAQTLPQQLQLGREHAIAFFRFMLKELGEACLVSVKILLQHMCMRVPDKAEYRTKAAQGFVTILQDFPDEQYAFMLKWIGVLSRNDKSPVRVFSLEILTLLLTQPERQLQGVTEEQTALASHAVLINQLLARCSDVAAVVRTRAITSFALCLESGGVSIKKTIQEMITPCTNTPSLRASSPPPLTTCAQCSMQVDQTANETAEGQGTSNNQSDCVKEGAKGNQDDASPTTPATRPSGTEEQQTPFRSVEVTEALDNSLPDRQGVISMLHRRAREEKVHVRRAALQALHKFILFEATTIEKEDMEVLCERCRDKALSVRKQALTSLTEVLMQFRDNSTVQSAWCRGVLAMVWDQETSIQDRCLEVLESTLLTNIAPRHRSKSEDHVMTWELLTLISKPENADLRRHFKKACRLWEMQKKLKGSIVTSIMSHIDTPNNQAAWSVLADIAVTKVSVDTKPVLRYWTDHNHTITAATEGDVWENVLRIIGCNAQSVASNHRSKLIGEFKSHLLRFDLRPVLISALSSAIHQLSRAECGENFHKSQEWGRDVLVACDQYLSAIVLEEDSSGDMSYDEDRMMCHLYTLGVVALLCPSVTPKRTPMLVQSFIATPCISAAGDSSDNISTGSQPLQVSQGSEASEEGSQGTQRSQSTQGSQSTQPLSQFRGCKMSDRVRAVAFLTLGKLCLQEKSVAKKCVPAMARELEVSASDAVRNNVIIILRDLCVRYATLVDPYVSVMAMCLRDPAPIVRRQSLELLTGLLQEDFLKWKGPLFFRFILTLLDPQPEISSFAEFCLGFHLLKRHPAMMSQHLLESIFVFNDYSKHNVFNKYPQSDRERELFSLKGKDNQSQRLKLYQFMLEHMEDEHRFQLTAKISQEVLGAVVDGILPYDQDSSELLQDALAILSSKEIKLSSMRSTKSAEDATDEMEMANVVIATAKKTLITQVVKKNMMENVIPLVLSLKHMLDKERSPLLKDLMAFLHELMKDYKNEIKDILAADRQLACEVEYDLRMFEHQQTEGAEQGQTTPGSANPDQAPARKNTPQLDRPSTPRSDLSTPVPRSAGKNTPISGSARRSGSAAVEERSIVPGGAPVQQSHTDKASTRREAVLRTVERLKERQLSAGGQDRRRLSSVKWAEDVVATSSAGSEIEQENADSNKPQTPQHSRRPLRAISTPSGLLSNVTFAGESNLTLPLVPPSPIPGHSKSYADVTGEEESEEVNIVFMNPPGARQTKPREWKVKVKSEEQVEEASLPAVVSSPLISRRRGRRLQTPS